MEATQGGTQRRRQQGMGRNVAETERWASLLGGTVLAVLGLRRGGVDGLGLALTGGTLVYRGATGYCPLYGALGVSTAEHGEARIGPAAGPHALDVEASATINRPAEEVYRTWRDFESHPRFARFIESVQTLSDTRSRWIVKGPTGMTWEWELEISQEREGEYIAWHTLPGADIPHRGTARFEPAPGGRGTEVHVRFKVEPPAGVIGSTIASYFEQVPTKQLRDDLRRFKQFVETGEVATTDGQPSARA